jgi:hypothetical protein
LKPENIMVAQYSQYKYFTRVSSLFYIAHIYAGDHEKTAERTASLNWPMRARAREVAAKFISSNPFFTILIKPNHIEDGQLVS